MVVEIKGSSIEIDTGYAGKKCYSFFARTDKNGQALPDARCAIVLGKNGSGKSTIARALSDGKNVKFFNEEGGSLGDECPNVYVFDEWFIGENFRMSDGEALKLIYEIRELRSLQETISSMGRFFQSNRVSDRPLELLRNKMRQRAPLPRLTNQIFDNQIIEGSDEPHDSFEEPQVSELSHKKEGFEDSVAKEESEEPTVGRISEDIHEDSTADDMSNRDEWREAWDSLSPEEQENITRKFSETSQKIQQYFERLSKQIEGFQMPRIVRDSRKAINNINALSAIVFGADPISVKYKEDKGGEGGYEILKGNKKVVPSSLSTGEQNVLSLCYFFAQMMDGEDCGSIQEFLAGNNVIVLDDPVSSFDSDNKYGVTALLGYLCQYILSQDSEAKLIIMTHDLSFALNMSKIIKAIDSNKLSCWELQKDSLNPLKESKFEDIDRYAGTLGNMYDFVMQGENATVIPSPNDVRRVWEAFLLFELGETSIANMDSIKNLSVHFSDNQKVERFMKVFIPQLFINNDSHAKSQVMSGNLYLTPTLEGKPYEDFVRNILCFMHIVSPCHIAWRIGGKKDEKEERQQKLHELLENMLEQYK